MLTLAAISTAQAADPTLNWSWEEGEHRRYYIENEVHLPAPVMLYQERNTQARLVALQTKLVIDCTPVELKRRETELRCDIDDVALIGAGMTGDRENLDPTLKEIDARLTDAWLQVMLRSDGRIRHIDLEGIDQRNRRLSQNAQTVRILLVRALAGLDFEFARTAEDEAHAWGQFESLLMDAPYNRGSQGSSEVVHVLRNRTGDRVTVESQGRGAAAPATDHSTGPASTYMMEMSSMTRFDTATGAMTQRRWTVIGEPTAGAAVNDGVNGVSYLQAGELTLLTDGVQAPELPESAQVAMPGVRQPSALQPWIPISSLGE